MQNPAHSVHCRRTSGVGPSEPSSRYSTVIPSNLSSRIARAKIVERPGFLPARRSFRVPAQTQIPPLALTAHARLGTALGMTVESGVLRFEI